MANRASVVVLALAAALMLSGCGTAINLVGYKHGPLDLTPRLSPEAQVYGGAAFDAGMLVWGGMVHVVNGAPLTWKEAAVASLLLLDLPLSAVGDTLTLPLTIYASAIRLAAANESSHASPADGAPHEGPN